MKTFWKNNIPFLMIIGLFFSCSREEPTVVGPAPVPVVTVKLNEAYSRGDTANPDWIEIYNPSSAAIDIGGYKIYDSGGQTGAKPKKEIPAGTSIASHGYYVVTVDDTTASGFGLSSSGETIWCENASGSLIDSVTIPALGIDTSYARVPDGGTWQKKSPKSKGSTNSVGGTILPVVMNEIYSRGVPADPDWIEIYNPSTVPLDLTGYKIYDGGGNLGTKPKKEFPSGSIIPANGFFVIVVDDTSAAGFGLSSGGDETWLENASGAVIDNVTIPAMPLTTQSYGRNPDGGSTWQLLNTITKGSPNQP